MNNGRSKIVAQLLVLLLLCSQSHTIAQTEYSVPLTFSVNSTALNRFIANQWNSITNRWTGNYQGLTYDVQLGRPTVVLVDNQIQILLKLNIASSVYNGNVSLSPTLVIPNASISLANIFASYSNLHDQVLAATGLADPRLRQIVEDALAPIDWIMYQGTVYTTASIRLSETADIAWTGLPSFSYGIISDEIQFTFTNTISARAPFYEFQYNRVDNEDFGLRVLSNDKIELIDAMIWPDQEVGQPLARWSEDPDHPTISTFDPSLHRYVATLHFDTNPTSSNMDATIYRIKVKRQKYETIWRLRSNPWFGNNSTWIYVSTNRVEEVHGE